MVSSKTARTDKTQRSDKTLALLAALLVLFCLRVSGQLLVAVFQVPFLPPMSEWQSGLLPYPVLVFFQFLIIALYGRICFDFYRQSGFFYVPQRMLAKPLLRVGLLYFVSVAIRLLIWTTMFQHHMWFSGTIPIFFHFVLASFLIVVAKHHCQEFSGLASSKPSALLKAGITQ
jgi:uncharacterized protein